MLLECGTEPEFFCTELVRTETAAEGAVRLYWAQRRGKNSVLLYTQVVPAALLHGFARLMVSPIGDFDAEAECGVAQLN